MIQIRRPIAEMTMPAIARPSPSTIPSDRLHSLWPMIEKIRPSRLHTNESTKPAIAIPEVRRTLGMTMTGGGIDDGKPVGICPGICAARLMPQTAQNAAPGVVAVPHLGQGIA